MSSTIPPRPKLSQLFAVGKHYVLTPVSGPPIPIWIAKLNSFEVEECNHEGRVARARMMTLLNERGTPEYDVLKADSERMSLDDCLGMLVQAKNDEHLVETFADLRSDKDWSERMLAMEDSGEQLADKPDDDPEKDHIRQLSLNFHDEVMQRLAQRQSDYREELAERGVVALREMVREEFAERKGLEAFAEAKQLYELYKIIRVCNAGVDVLTDDPAAHVGCDHSQCFLEGIREARLLPDAVRDEVMEQYHLLLVPTEHARFGEGPTSSSDSSGPASKPEGSEASGPAETPATPATTSS